MMKRKSKFKSSKNVFNNIKKGKFDQNEFLVKKFWFLFGSMSENQWKNE